MTGVYVATSEPVGAPDDVVELSLGSVDKRQRVDVLARIARVVRQDDRVRGARIIGAAFEFLPLDETPQGVAELLSHCAKLELGSAGSLVFDDDVRAQIEAGGQTHECGVRSFGPTWLNVTLAGAELESGTPVQVRIGVGSALEGTVRSSLEIASTGAVSTVAVSRRVQIEVSERQRAELLYMAQRSLSFRSAMKVPARRSALSGQLRKLPLESLLALLERGRYSGVLCAGDGNSFYSFEIEQGRLRSWVRPLGIDPNEALLRVLSLREGEFKFHARTSLDGSLDGVSDRLLRDLQIDASAPPIG